MGAVAEISKSILLKQLQTGVWKSIQSRWAKGFSRLYFLKTTLPENTLFVPPLIFC